MLCPTPVRRTLLLLPLLWLPLPSAAQSTSDAASAIFDDTVLHDADPHPPTQYTVHEILSKSSNIGTIFISQLIGFDQQERYMRAFGLGEATALDFPGEARGILKPYTQWNGTEKVTVSYGQGVASTAIQLASAVNTLANDGVYVAPKLVKSVVGADGTEQPSMARCAWTTPTCRPT